MIIFDLDGTLADCEHRRHFIDPSYDQSYKGYSRKKSCDCPFPHSNDPWVKEDGKKWKPRWDKFEDACDLDTPIQPVIDRWNEQITLGMMNVHQIWSGRSERVRDKTMAWLDQHLLCFNPNQLKMRPIGDSQPDDELKETWLNEYLASMYPRLPIPTPENIGTIYYRKDPIHYVIDDRPKVVRMWRRRGIFVFDVNQTGKEF